MTPPFLITERDLPEGVERVVAQATLSFKEMPCLSLEDAKANQEARRRREREAFVRMLRAAR